MEKNITNTNYEHPSNMVWNVYPCGVAMVLNKDLILATAVKVNVKAFTPRIPISFDKIFHVG